MAFGAKLTPLTTTEVVGEDHRRRLKGYGITTVEELLSAAKTSPRDIARILDIDGGALGEMVQRAESILDEESLRLLDAPVQKRGMGAKPPGQHSERR